MEFTDQIQTVQNDSKHTNNRDPNEPPTICRSHHVEYAQINITVVPAKYSFAIQRAKQQIKSTGNQAANQDYCTFELLSVSIAQLVGQVLPVYLFRLLLLCFFPAVYLLSVYRKCWILRKITKARPLIQKKTWIETTSFERNEVYPCVNNVSNEFSITRNCIEQQIGSVWVILKQIYHKNPVCFSLSNLQLSKGILKFCSFPRCLNLHCLPLFHSCITNHLQ